MVSLSLYTHLSLCRMGGLDPATTRMDDPLARQSLDAMFLGRTAAEWETALAAEGIPATAVVAAEDSSLAVERLTGESPTVDVVVPVRRRRRQQTDIDEGEEGADSGKTLALLRSPFSLGEAASAPGPLLGSHNASLAHHGFEAVLDDEDDDYA